MAEGATERLGIDVGVGGFDAFEKHIERVNQLLQQFGERARQFALDAPIFAGALQAFADSGKKSGEGLLSFRRAVSEAAKGNRELGNITKSVNSTSTALERLKTASSGINLQSITSQASVAASAASRTASVATTGRGGGDPTQQRLNDLSTRIIDQLAAADDARKRFVQNLRISAEEQSKLLSNLTNLAAQEEQKFLAILERAQQSLSRTNIEALQSFSRAVAQTTLQANQQARETARVSQEAAVKQEAIARVTEAIQQRRIDRRIADEERLAAASAKFAQQNAAIQARAAQDFAKTEATREANRNRRNQIEDDAKAERQAIQRAAQERVNAVADSLKRTAQLQRDARLRALSESLLGLREQRAAERRINEEFLAELNTINRRARNTAFEFSEASLREFKRTADEIRATTRSVTTDVRGRSQVFEPSLRAQGRARIRDDISGASFEEFKAGIAERRARSSNIIARTIQQNIDRIGDSITILGFQARVVGETLLAPFKLVVAPIRLVISLIGGLISAFQAVSNTAQQVGRVISAPFQIASSIFGSKQKQQAPAQIGGADRAAAQAKQVQQAQNQVNQAIDNSGRSIQILSGNTVKLSSVFSNLFNSQKKVQQSFEQTNVAINSFNRETTKISTSVRTINLVLSPVVQISKAFNTAVGSVRAFVASFTSAASPVNSFNQSLGRTTTAANEAGEAVGRAGRIAETAFGTAFGQLAARSIETVVSGLKNLTREGILAVGEFESMALGFQTFARREILDDNPMLSFAEAEEIASERAEELLHWTQQLAIVSPFEEADVAKIFRTAQAYDFTSKEAQVLTDVLVDFASGSGQGADAANNVALALGQMFQAGKVTGQEIRQLVNNGVPALRILSEATGKTVGELREFFDKGGILEGKSAVTAIAQAIGTEFAGAAEKSQNTIRGLISSLSDLRKVALRNITRPFADDILKPIVTTLVDQVNTGEFQDRMKDLGQAISDSLLVPIELAGTLFGTFRAILDLIPAPVLSVAANFAKLAGATLLVGGAFNIVMPAIRFLAPLILGLLSPVGLLVGALVTLATAWQNNWFGIQQVTANAITSVIGILDRIDVALDPLNLFRRLSQAPPFVLEIAGQIQQTFSNLLTNMVQFGANIVEAFANGIVSAVSVVIDAIGAIGSAIAYLLEPGSPPRLLPDLDIWGQEAANVWLEGWTKADFDIFNTISQNVQKALNSIDPDIDQGEIRKIQQRVFGVIEEFQRTGDTSLAIGRLGLEGDLPVGPLESVRNLTAAILNASQATKIYEATQKELNETTDRFAKLLEPVDQKLKSLENTEKTLDETKRLRSLESVINSRFATEEQKRRAALELQKIQATQEKRSLEDQRDAAVSEVQARLTAAEKEKQLADEALSVMQERFNIQFQFTAQLNQASKAAGDLAEKLGKLKKEKAGKETLEIEGLPDLGDLTFPEIDIDQKIAPAIERFQKKISEGQENVTKAVTGLRTTIETQVFGIRDAFNTGLNGIEDPETTGLGKAANKIGIIVNKIDTSAGNLEKHVVRLRDAFNTGFEPDRSGESSGAPPTESVTGVERLALKTGRATQSIQTALSAATKAAQGFMLDFEAAFEAAGKDETLSPIQKFFVALESEDITERLGAIRDKITTGINNLFSLENAVNFSTFATNLYARISEALTGEEVDVFAVQLNVLGALVKIGVAAHLLSLSIKASFDSIKESFGNLSEGVKGIFSDNEGDIFSDLRQSASLVVATFGPGGEFNTAIEELIDLFGIKLVPVLLGASAGLASLLGPIGWVTLGIAGLGLAWENNVLNIKTIAEENFPVVAETITSTINTVKTVIGEAIQLFKDLGEQVGLLGGTKAPEGQQPEAQGGQKISIADKLSQGLAGLDVTSVASGLASGLVTIIKTAITKLPQALTDALQSVSSISSDVAEGSLSFQFGKLVGSAISTVLVSVIGLAGTLLNPENIFEAVKTTLGIAGSIAAIIGDVILGIFTGITTTIEQFVKDREKEVTDIGVGIQRFFINALNAPINAINSVSEFLNSRLPESLQISKISVIPITLRPEDFQVLTPDQIKVPDILSITAPEVINPSELFSIGGQEKLLVDPTAVFAINPDLKEIVDPSQLIEIGGEQKLVVNAEDVIETDTSFKITVAPGEVIEIDKTKPITITAPIDLDATVRDAALASVVTGAGSGATSGAAQKIVQQLQATLDSVPLNLPPINTGDPKLDTAAKAAGINFATAFGNIDSETQKRLIEKILTLPTDQAAVLSDVGLGVTNGIVNSITVTPEQISTIQSTFGDVRKGAIEGLTTLDSEDTGSIVDFIKDIDSQMSTAAEAQSPSELTKRSTGVPMGQGVIEGIKEALSETTGLTEILSSILGGETVLSSIDSGAAAIIERYNAFATKLSSVFSGASVQAIATFATIRQNAISEANLTRLQVPKLYQELSDESLDIYETFFEETDDLFADSYKSLIRQTGVFRDDFLRIIVDLVTRTVSQFSSMLQRITTIVNSLFTVVETVFKRIRDRTIALATETVEGVRREFERMSGVIQGALNNILTELGENSLLARFEQAGRNLGRAIVNGIVGALTGSAGNDAVTEIAEALVSVLNRAVRQAGRSLDTGGGGGTGPIFDPTPDNPNDPRLRSLLSSADSFETAGNSLVAALSTLNERLLPLTDGGSVVTAGLSSQATLGPTVQVAGGVVNITNEYVLQMTVSERRAERVVRNFQLFEALAGA